MPIEAKASVLRAADRPALDALPASAGEPAAWQRAVLLGVLFVSGLVALVYQVLWARQLGLLFGSTAHASAATLAIFFTGLGLGARVWGARVAHHASPLRIYALLELGVAVSALLYFGLVDVYDHLYPPLATALAERPTAHLLLKLVLSAVLLLPASVFMGGTLPVLGEALVVRRSDIAPTGATLLAINTLGAAAGALAAGFWLPVHVGVRATYLAATGVNAALAVTALLLSRADHRRDVREQPETEPREVDGDALLNRRTSTPSQILGTRALAALAFGSGFAVLALEVLWTRMLALVLNSSAFAFTAALVGLLIALACGAALAGRLVRRARQPLAILVTLLTFAGLTVGLSPFVFEAWTGGFGYLKAGPAWWSYLGAVLACVAVVLLLPGMFCGAVLPFLLRWAARTGDSPGEVLGRLTSINTLGGVAGSLAAGFLLLPGAGLWGSIRALAVLYLAAAIALAAARRLSRLALAAGVALLCLTTVADPARLSIVRLDAAGDEEEEAARLHRVWQTAYGIVSVLQRGSDREIRVDNSYTLGGLGARDREAAQADLPLMLQGRPRSVFFLGLGTGITAGAALAHPVERVTVAELIPEVVEASRLYFAEEVGGLFTDARAHVQVGDGRAMLRASPERFDVVVSDLFVPWHAGTGSLYAREHFASARAHLAPGGLFAQWLPLYQLSARELRVIARTMLAVFPQVTLWRGDFFPSQPIVLLIGQEAGAEMDPAKIVNYLRALPRHGQQSDATIVALAALFYAGNLTAARETFARDPVSSDDRPVLEHLAALTQAQSMGSDPPWLTGPALVGFYDELLARVPPERDPYLARLEPKQVGYVRAGASLFRALVAKRERNEEEARRWRDDFERRVPYGVFELFRRRLSGIDG